MVRLVSIGPVKHHRQLGCTAFFHLHSQVKDMLVNEYLQWLSFSPVADTAATFFSTDTGVINWLSTAFLFSFAVAAPATIYTLYSGGPRLAFITASVLILLGNWIRYGGTRSSPPRFGVVMFGQILTGLAQPFVLSAPTRYSELWFTPQGRVSATAVASLANAFGGALGQLINPLLCSKPSDIPNMTLYVAIISSVATIPTLFLPEKPKTPVAPSSAAPRPSLPDTLRLLSRNPNFWLLLTVFSLNVGLFNCISSILEQVLKPYGFPESQAGIAGALLILIGLLAAAVTSPLVDRTKRYLFLIKTFVPIIAVCDLVFIWAPGSRSEVAPYLILSVLGAASFSLLPIALEWLVEVTYPATPEASSTIIWTAGQVLGGLFIVISNALRASAESSPPHHMGRALIFQAVIAIASVAPTMLLGVIGQAYRGRAEVDAQAGSTVTSPTAG